MHRWTSLIGLFLLAGCTTAESGDGDAGATAPGADGGVSPGGDAAESSVDGAARATDAVAPSGDAARLSDGGPPSDLGLPDVGPPDLGPLPDANVDCPEPLRFYRDADHDGFGDPADDRLECALAPGFADNADDCDDGNPQANPDRAESCDGADNDCDGEVDNQAFDSMPFFRDEDGDGLGDGERTSYACQVPDGYVPNTDDCNDASREIGVCGEGTFCSLARRCMPDGECADPGDCGEAMTCNPDNACEPGGLCGGVEIQANRNVANLLLVLDRSCSMRNRVAGVRKWQAAVDAIVTITQEFEGDIRFGLTLFPDGERPACPQGDIPIPLGDGGDLHVAAAIRDLLQAALDNHDDNWPDGPCVTNIDSAIVQAATDPGLDDMDRSSYLMLITDGRQAGCSADGGNNGTVAALQALFGERGVATFVVGFGGAVSTRWLTDFSTAGGVPRDGDPNYYQADDPDALLAALRQIGAQVVSCEFALDAVPENDLDLTVFFDNDERVPRDAQHGNGWDYDAATNTVTFYGPACQRLRENEVADVNIVFGCQY